jgi:hypothetical protein
MHKNQGEKRKEKRKKKVIGAIPEGHWSYA